MMKTPDELNDKWGNKAMPTLFSGGGFIGNRPSAPTKTFLEKASEASAKSEDAIFTTEQISLPEQQKARFTYAIVNAGKLLEKKKYQGLLEQCVYLLDFSEEQKDVYFTPVINEFVEFVQNLPETNNSYFSDLGGFIAHALMRATAALSMCRAYFQAEKPESNTSLTATESLWMYVLFTAGIFCGVGRVFSDLVIELYDEHGKHTDRWNPFDGSMLKAKASFYDYDFEESKHIDLFSRRLSVVMAKQLMPSAGFTWLSSDKEALSLWLALLEENQRDGGTLSPFLARADAMGINNYFDEKRMQREYANLDDAARDKVDLIAKEKFDVEEKKWLEREGFEKDFEGRYGKEEKEPEKKPEQQELVEQEKNARELKDPKATTKAGIAFLKWLTMQMKARRLEFNTAIFYLPAGAVFLPTPLFEAFKKQNPYYKNTQDIINSFNQLQLSSKDHNKSEVHTMVRQDNNHEKIEGVVLNNAQLVLPKVIDVRLANDSVYQVNTSQIHQYVHLMTSLQPVGNGEMMNLTNKNSSSLMFAM